MRKIAIVDDEKNILDMLSTFLEMNYDVTTFQNPVIALDAIKQGDFDVVLCDIMMPQMSGLDLLKQLHEYNKELVIIMMTAFDTMDRALEAHKFGARNYIKKPFESLATIQEKIEEQF